MPQAASVLSIDIFVSRLHRGLQWDSCRDGGSLSKLSL